MSAMRSPSSWQRTLLFPPLLVTLFLIALGRVMAPAAWAEDVPAKRECATCHIMWLSDFKRKDVTPLIPYDPRPEVNTGRQDVSSTERMCFSCHDGFMLDSRSFWKKGRHSHPVGVKPSDRVKLPVSEGKTTFPLNDEGKVYCGTCHTAHGSDWQQKESPLFLRAKNVGSSLCVACHPGRASSPAGDNHPVLRKPAVRPERLLEAGARLGHDGKIICQSCHRTHGAAARKLLVLDNRGGELCGACHSEQRKVVRTKHDLSLMAPEARNDKGEAVAELGPCSPCHSVHDALGPKLWARRFPPGADPNAAKCLACHRAGEAAEKKTVGKHSHPLDVEAADVGVTATRHQWTSRFPLLADPKRLAPLPLFERQGGRAEAGGRIGCLTCHDPHVWSPLTSASSKPPPDPRKIEASGDDSFLRLPEKSLCVNCHVDKQTVLLSKHNPTLSPSSAKDKRPKGPGAIGACRGCHQPHNAKGAYLWARDSGPGKGAIEKLCTDCHRSGGIAGDRVTGTYSHPVGIGVGDVAMPVRLPLFDANGKPDAAGHIDCATCHEPHQWDSADAASRAGANPKAEGDGRNSFLRLSDSKAFLCADCHGFDGLFRYKYFHSPSSHKTYPLYR